MPICANMAKFRVGSSADVLYVEFYARVICDGETKISGRRRKTDFTAMVEGLDVRGTGFQGRYCRLNVRCRDRLGAEHHPQKTSTQKSDTSLSERGFV